MENDSIDDLVIFGMVLTQNADRRGHPLKTSKCPPVPEFERLAARGATWSLDQYIHFGKCPYCRLNLKLFRAEMGIKPWWEEKREQFEELRKALFSRGEPLHASFDGLNVSTSLPAHSTVPALVQYKDAGQSPASVDVMAVSLIDGRYLALSLRMAQPHFHADQMPVELTMITHPEGEPVDSFLLPGLVESANQYIKTDLPPALQQEWKNIQTRADLPLRFILRTNADSARN